MSRTFLGKYRAVITDTKDPLKLGRVRARVPDVTGNHETGWAFPCMPFGGDQAGFFALPSVGATVWFEFEHGDPDHPICTGTFWSRSAELPPEAAQQPDRRVEIRTAAGHRVIFDDGDRGGIALEASGGQRIAVGPDGIEITDGKGGTIKISGGKVTVNDGALEVT